MKIIITENAKIDLNEIVTYITENNSHDIALKNYKKIKDRINYLKDFPESGRIVPELNRLNIIKYREIIVAPWRIIYFFEKEIVYILHVIDGRRNIDDIIINKIIKQEKP